MRFYLRAPWLLSPLFCVNAWRRSRRRGAGGAPGPPRAAGVFGGPALARCGESDIASPDARPDATARGRGLRLLDVESITAPTLVITGEPELDHVVPPHHTLGYARLAAARGEPDVRAHRPHRHRHAAGAVRRDAWPPSSARADRRRWPAGSGRGRWPADMNTRRSARSPGPSAASKRCSSRRRSLQASGCARPWSSRTRIRCTAARCTRRRVYRATKALAGLGLRGAAVQFPGRRAERRHVRQRRRRARGLPRRPRLHGVAVSRRRAVGGGVLVRRVRRAHGRRARRPRLDADRHRAGAARCTTSPSCWRAAKPKYFVQGERDEICPLAHMRGVLRASCRSRSSSWWCLARTTCSMARSTSVGAARSREMFATTRQRERTKSGGKVTCTTQSSSPRCGRPSARRLPARCARPGPTRWAAVVLREALARAPGLDPVGGRRRDHGLRDAGGRAGIERRAHREPPRRRAGQRVGGHREPVLLLRPAGHRVRRRADHVRLRRRGPRGRHRVDEPHPDGRPQGLAQPGTGEQVSRTSI